MSSIRQSANEGRRVAIGLMSGTSMDGIDAAVVEITGGTEGSPLRVQLLAFENTPYPAWAREEIAALCEADKATVDRVGWMNVWLGERFAEAALAVAANAGIAPGDVAVIGSHGQTIWHAPEYESWNGYEVHYTVQIGEGAVIALRTGIPCVSDFRAADMAAGGQGAPLVPFTEFLLYREETRTLLMQNIGGIGNVTVLPAGCRAEEVYAFDTGPGNVLIDGVVSRLYAGERTMDVGGELARLGKVSGELLAKLQQDEYYRMPWPKSTGRERFGAAYVEWLMAEAQALRLSAEDLTATVTMLTAWSIGDAYERWIRPQHKADAMIVGGGGSYNRTLMEMLRAEMAARGVQVLTQEEIGGSSDAKEAIAFAVLADYAIAGRPNNLPGVTGARRAVVMGKISYP